jgi:excisionase family DNA binding protein
MDSSKKKGASMVRVYSVDEAAEALRLSHWTIRAWIKSGKLRSSRVGVRRVIRESDLRRMIVDDPPKAKAQ